VARRVPRTRRSSARTPFGCCGRPASRSEVAKDLGCSSNSLRAWAKRLAGFFEELGAGLAAGRADAEVRGALGGKYDSYPEAR